MKKLNYFFNLLIVMCLGFTANAAICTQTFTISGNDDDPTVLTITAADISCNAGGVINSLTLVNAAASLVSVDCGGYYDFDLVVDAAPAVSGCGALFNATSITGFSSLTITSFDLDAWSDAVTITIDVEVDYTAAACPGPSGGVATSITANSADIGWTENGVATTYDVEWGVGGFAPTGAASAGLAGTTSNPESLSGLTSNTTYDFYVRADCAATGGTGLSAWSGPFSFTTEKDYCAGDAFEDTGGAGNYGNSENETWTICPDNPGDVVSATFNSFVVEGNGSGACYDNLFIYDGATVAATAITPASTGLGAGTAGFCYESPTDGTANLTGETITSTDASGCLTFNFTSDGSATFAGFNASIVCGPPPTCSAPNALTATAITTTSADLGFTDNAGATEWDIEWGTAGFAATGTPSAGFDDFTTNPVNLSGLTANTAYEFYVRADCGAGAGTGQSTWAGPFAFTTAIDYCASGVFEDPGGAGNYAVNENETWTICPDNPGDVVSATFNSFVVEGNGAGACYDNLFIYDGATVAATAITPASTGLGAGTAGFCYQSPTDGTADLTGETIISTDASGCLTFNFTSDGSAQFAGFNATIVCGPPPTCAAPNALTATAITTTSADLGFTDNAGATEWDIEWGVAGFAATGTPSAGFDDFTTNPINLSGLTANTAYEFYVRADCGAGAGSGQSTWAGPFAFTTLIDYCAAGVFEDPGGAGNYGINENETWTICPDNPGDVVSATFNSFVVEGNGAGACYDNLFIYDGTSVAATAITPASLGLGAGTAGFCYQSPTDGTADLTGNTIISTDASGCLTFNFTSDGSAQFAGFNATIVCGPPPTCLAPTALTATGITTTSADLGFTDNAGATEWDIEWGVAGFAATGTPSAGFDDFTTNPVNLSGLTGSTSYEFYVRADCDAGAGLDESTWTGPFAFNTSLANDDCAGAIALPVNLDGTCTLTTTFDNTGATFSAAEGAPSGACSDDAVLPNGGIPADVWFTATVPPSGIFDFEFISYPGISSIVELYTGTCGGGLTAYAPVNCVNTDVRTFTGLTPGSTVYLRVWDYGSDDFGSMEVCLTEVICSNPTASTTRIDDCGNNQFSVEVTITDMGSATSFIIEDGVGTFLANAPGLGTYTVGPFPAGTPVDIILAHNVSALCDVGSFGVVDACPPANDECANATVVSCGTNLVGENNFGSTDNGDATGCFSLGNGVWYSFVGNGDDVTVSSFADFDHEVSVSSSNDCIAFANVNCSDVFGANNTESVTFTSVLGTQYYIYIGHYSFAAFGTFDLSITCVTPPPPGTVVWNGSVDTDWNTAANWTGGVPPFACADHIFVPVVANQPVVTLTQEVGELTTASNATVTVLTGGNLNICGDLNLGSGSITDGDGPINLLGTGAGTSIIAVTDASVNNLVAQANYSITSGTMNITNSLTLDGGDFANAGGSVVLVSDVAGTAYFDDFTNAGNSYSGDLTVQRYVTAGFGLGQRYFGSAVSGSSVSGLDGTYASGYPTGAIVPNACDPNMLMAGSPYSNLFEWNEAGPYPTTCAQEGWYAIAGNSAIGGVGNVGRGYSGWMNDGSTLEVTGTPNSGAQAYGPLMATAPVALTDARGWHLLANPYPSPMNIDAVTADGFTSPQYYNASSGAYSGTFQPALVAGTEVPVMQGFVAQTAGSNTFTPDNSDRIASNNANFAKSTAWYDYRLDVEVIVNGNADATYLFYSDNNTAQFDASTDCVKRNSDLDMPTLYTKLGTDQMSLNGFHLNDLGTSVPMGLIAPELGTYTFNFDGEASFPTNTTIYVEDLVTGAMHDISKGAYSFSADPANNGSDRFMIHFVLPASFNLIDPTCDNVEGIIIDNTKDNREFAIVKDGVEVTTGKLDGSSHTLTSGDYTIEVYDQFGGSQSYDIFVEEFVHVDASVIASQNTIEEGESVDFDFVGNGASNYEWTINGQLVAQTELFTYTFSSPGEYIVEVFGSNENCEAIAHQTITVTEKTTSIVNIGNKGTLNIYETNGNVVLDFNNVNEGMVVVKLFNMLGQEIASKDLDTNGKQTIENRNWADGIYIVKMEIAGNSISEKLLLTK